MEEKDRKLIAIELAKTMVEELYEEIGKDAVEEAKAMGMATSMYAEKIEKKKKDFLEKVDIERETASEIFDIEISHKFYQ
jgi:hypothetical protein